MLRRRTVRILGMVLGVGLSVAASSAAIMAYGNGTTVTPAAPLSTEIVTIRVENDFGSEAGLESDAIVRNGNTFVVQQNVKIACTLPSSPTVTSAFEVGPLAPGNYDVAVTIQFTGLGFPNQPCSPAPITQQATFTVAPDLTVPALDGRALFLMTLGLVATALVALRGR